jgi:adenylate cyclase
MEAQQGFSKSREESLKQALEWTKKSIAMDDSNALFHATLAWLLSLERQYDNALAECERAIELGPNSSYAHIWMAFVLIRVGRPEEAVPYAEQALRLNPLGPAWWYRQLGLAHFGAERYEEAIAWHKKSLNSNPKDVITHIALTTAYSWAGRHEDARAQAAEVLRINPNFSIEERAKSFAYKNQADLDRFLDGLRKAGLK